MKTINYSILFLLLVLFSCNNDDDYNESGSSSGKLIRVLYSGEVFQEFTYHSSGLLLEEKSKFWYKYINYNNKKQITTIEFYYDPSIVSSSSSVFETAQKRKEWVSPSNTEKSLTNYYKYIENNLIEIRSERKDGQVFISKFQTDNQNRIEKQIFYTDNIEAGFIQYFYDENGNVIKRLHYIIDNYRKPSLSTTTLYEFDSKFNPYNSFKAIRIPGIYTNLNNITKETYILHFEVDSWIQKVQITENSYEYNSAGFPVRENGIKTFEYY